MIGARAATRGAAAPPVEAPAAGSSAAASEDNGAALVIEAPAATRGAAAPPVEAPAAVRPPPPPPPPPPVESVVDTLAVSTTQQRRAAGEGEETGETSIEEFPEEYLNDGDRLEDFPAPTHVCDSCGNRLGETAFSRTTLLAMQMGQLSRHDFPSAHQGGHRWSCRACAAERVTQQEQQAAKRCSACGRADVPFTTTQSRTQAGKRKCRHCQGASPDNAETDGDRRAGNAEEDLRV